MSSDDALLQRAHEHARRFLATLPDRAVNARNPNLSTTDASRLAEPVDPIDVLDGLARTIDEAGLATAGPRYFGFVTGGSYPVAVAADWMVSAWDQNAGLHVMSPAVAAIEDVTASWLLDLLALPRSASVGFVTGGTMANVTCLAAGRDEVLRRRGWDVEAQGLQGAPSLRVIAGMEAHASIDSAARLLGFGTANLIRVPADAQGRMIPDALTEAMGRGDGPTIVCVQAGHVNTGAFDPFIPLIDVAHRAGAWVHVDGAFGLWARAAADRRLRAQAEGLDAADSWAVDAHKWLNVPYDSGIAIVAHPAAHRAAMAQHASYLLRAEGERRDGMDWTPEASRRARAIPIYAVLKTLGRDGVSRLVENGCARARQMAQLLRDEGIDVLNDVVLNQVLVRFSHEGRNITPAVIARVQRESVCWVGGTTWTGEPAMRISISNWSTSERDIELSAASIIRARGR